MIRVRGLDRAPSLEDIARHLSGTGIDLDASYGPFELHGAYVVRGMATPEAVERARRIAGVEVFGDLGISPTDGE